MPNSTPTQNPPNANDALRVWQDDADFLRKENARLRQLLSIYRPGLSLPTMIADQLDKLRIELVPHMAVKAEAYSRFERPLKQALWAARELGERVLVIAYDKRSADDCVRMLRTYANEAIPSPLLGVNRHDYLEFANKGSIRVVAVSSGIPALAGARIDNVIEAL